MKSKLLFLVGLSLVLSGCRIGEPNRLEFASDARVLRGRYTGTVDTRYASNTVALSADNTVLAMGEGDGRAVVQLWDAATQTPIKSMGALSDLDSFVADVALSADGSVVASLLGSRVQLWDSRTGTRRRTLNTEKFVGACSYCAIRFDLSSDGRYVAVGKRRVALFDARTGAHLRRFDLPSDWLEALVFSADGTRLAALSTDLLESDPPHTFHVRVWNPLTGEPVFSYSGETATPHLGLSADGRKLAFVDGQQAQVIDIDTMQTDTMQIDTKQTDTMQTDTVQAVATFPLPKDFSGLALDSSGSRLALTTFAYSETSRPATLIFDTATRRQVAELDGVGLMNWSQDGSFALAYSSLEQGKGPMLLNGDDFSEVGEFINGKLHQVVLEATPSYIDDTHYAVSGTLELDEEAPIAFTGQVRGSEAQRYLRPQARLPSAAKLTLKLQGHPWTLHGFQEWESPEYDRRQVHDWEGYVLDTTRLPSPGYATDGSLTLDRATASR